MCKKRSLIRLIEHLHPVPYFESIQILRSFVLLKIV